MTGQAGYRVGHAVMAAIGNENWSDPAWESLRRDLVELAVIKERYSELVRPDDEPLRSLVAFDFLVSIADGVRERPGVARWQMCESEGIEFARQLHDDPSLRTSAATAAGLSLEEFDAQAPDKLRATRGPGPFPSLTAVTMLETGSAH